MRAQPNPTTVANTADLLRCMTIENAADALRKIMSAVAAGMVEQFGWTEIDAREFAIKFAESVAAEIQAQPGERVLH